MLSHLFCGKVLQHAPNLPAAEALTSPGVLAHVLLYLHQQLLSPQTHFANIIWSNSFVRGGEHNCGLCFTAQN